VLTESLFMARNLTVHGDISFLARIVRPGVAVSNLANEK
jgi:hypothetical protein